jgi:hypothetical protein
VKPIPLRVQMGLAAFGYAAALLVAAALLYVRHLQELRYPAEASGGMWAGGDLMLGIFIVGLFLLPTAFLIWVTAPFEAFYTGYSRFLLVLSLTSPVALSLLLLGKDQVGESLMSLSLYRLFGSPFILVGLGISRLVARFDRARRFASSALLIEVLTLGTGVALLIYRLH